MLSSPDNSIEANSARSQGSHSVPEKSSAISGLDTELVFRLIDSILPFEACLYHQVLPLSLEGSRLRLGMVNMEDSAALDYVRRILAYMNCSLMPQTITTELHHTALSTYLSYTGNRQQGRSQSAQSAVKSLPEPAPVQSRSPAEAIEPSEPIELSEPPQAPLPAAPPEAAATLIDPNDPPSATVAAPEPPAAPESPPKERSNEPPNYKATLILETDEALSFAKPPEPPPTVTLPTLDVNANHLTAPIEVLTRLPADQLLHELLGRLLVGGIGRLYFERQPQQGRILWSQNGVLQSVLEAVPIELLQGVVNELKQLTHLPLEPVQKPRQVEIERLHQRQRLLLRLRVMPGTYGEEATLQVLRGAALKFYQQQQLATISRDALKIAQELQTKVEELQTRTSSYPALSSDQMNILPALDAVLKSVGRQLELLKELKTSDAPGENSDR